ncbi:MAG: hypothetical protein ACO3CG_04060 [Ilumatobacteraceae bacterium]
MNFSASTSDPARANTSSRTRLGLGPAEQLAWVVHTVLVGILLWMHEPWRDELQAWSIAMASDTPWDLLPNTRLEGRPPGWQLLLWPFAQVVTSVRILQLVAFVVGSTAAWWWLRRSALSSWLKTVVLFGFLFTGGYFVHSRDYVLSFLILLAAVTTYEQRRAGMRLAVVLCALAWVNAFSLAMAIAFFAAAWGAELPAFRKSTEDAQRRFVESALLCLGWFGLSAYLTLPTDDNQFQVGVYKGIGRALTRSFIPLNYEWSWLQRTDDFIAVGLLVLVLVYAWSRSRVAFAFCALTIALLLYNLTYGYGDYWWHFGNAYLVVFVSTTFATRRAGNGTWVQRVGTAGVIIIALLNLAATHYGAGREVHSYQTYSLTAPAAAKIREICDDCTVIVDYDGVGAGISALLGGRKLYYLNRSEFGTFAKFSRFNTTPTWNDALAAMARFEKPLLVQAASLTGPAPASVQLVAQFGDGRHDSNLIWQLASRPIVPDDD